MKRCSNKMTVTFLLTFIMTLFSCNIAVAAIDVYEFDSEQQEAQYRGLIAEFRCPKCQNQNLAGSDAPIAQDLKQKTYEMVQAGQSDAQIREYMYDRYGDFISYKPPVRPSTWILWFFPPVLLLLLIAGWIWRTKRQAVAVSSASTMGATPKQSHNDATSANTRLNSSTTDVPTTTNVDNDSELQQADKPEVASSLTTKEKEALAALLAEHDDTPSSTQQSEHKPARGDK